MHLCGGDEAATCKDNYNPVSKESLKGQCQYTCVKPTTETTTSEMSPRKADPNEKLAGGSAFSLSVNKLRFEISGGACHNNVAGNDLKKLIEFGVDVKEGADRYQPPEGVPTMMCLGHYFSQPSMMVKVSDVVIDFFYNATTRTAIAEIRNDTYNIATGTNEGALRQRTATHGTPGNGQAAKNQSAVSPFIVFNQPTDKTGFKCEGVPGAETYFTITTEAKCRQAAEWYTRQPGEDPRGYKKTFEQTMSSVDRPPGCHIAGNGISFNSNSQSQDKDGHDALVCAFGSPHSITATTATPSMNVGRKIHTFSNGGCGWINLANVSLRLNGTVNVAPSFLFTDGNGWILSNQILNDLKVDPGPNIVFASSYYGGNSVGMFDYCDGFRISSRLKDEEKVMISYKSEPLLDNKTIGIGIGGGPMSKSCNGVTIDAGGRGGHNSVTTKAFTCNNIEYCCAHVCYGGTNSADCGNDDFCGCQKGYWSTYTAANSSYPGNTTR
jgi:hypothetical protein